MPSPAFQPLRPKAVPPSSSAPAFHLPALRPARSLSPFPAFSTRILSPFPITIGSLIARSRNCNETNIYFADMG